MMTLLADTLSVDELDGLEPRELLRWAYETHGRRAAIVTSFQGAGTAMIDIAYRASLRLRVLTVDTLRLHRETYDFIEAIEARYALSVERFTPDPERLSRMVGQHGEFLFFDSKAKQEYCCQVRKVEPNARALATLDVWITGLRRDQSSGRQKTPKAAVAHAGGRPILKLCPLADWSNEQVEDYLAEHDVPRNALSDRGYASIGCEICSTPTLSTEDQRAGRWRWFNHLGEEHGKECGIHHDGGGI